MDDVCAAHWSRSIVNRVQRSVIYANIKETSVLGITCQLAGSLCAWRHHIHICISLQRLDMMITSGAVKIVRKLHLYRRSPRAYFGTPTLGVALHWKRLSVRGSCTERYKPECITAIVLNLS